MKNRSKFLIHTLVVLLVLVFGFTACAPTTPTETPAVTETLSADQETAESPTVPSPTSAPELPTVLFMVGAQANPEMAVRIEEALRELAAGSQQDFKVLQGLSEDQIAPNVALVVGLGQDLDLAGAATRAPQTAFVAVGHPEVVPAGNLSVVGDPTSDQERQSFMAGYLTALLSNDYKVAALTAPEAEWRTLVLDAFTVGAEFFCGSCRPLYPPYLDFPQSYDLSEEAAAADFRPTIDSLAANGVEIVYVPGPLATPDLLTYLGERGIKVVGDQSPDMIRNNWVGTVVADPVPALEMMWSDWAAGVEGLRLPGKIRLIDTDAGLVSEGRQRLFDETNADLEAGLIFPRSVP
jgi:basic membrane lipoprotein Med (substrate-binding protein (PBP1-ABC) superfamily)